MPLISVSDVLSLGNVSRNIEAGWIANVLGAIEEGWIKPHLCGDAYSLLLDKIANDTLTPDEAEFVRLLRNAGVNYVVAELQPQMSSKTTNAGTAGQAGDTGVLTVKRQQHMMYADMYLRGARAFARATNLPYVIERTATLQERTGLSFPTTCKNC